jgi:hypothetical protein
MGASFSDALGREDLLGAHRVDIFEHASHHVQLGVMRHELEHARQFDHDERRLLYRLHPLIRLSMTGLYRGEGSAGVYQEIPHERDANLAATSFVQAELEPPQRCCSNRPIAHFSRPRRRRSTGSR